MFPNREIKSINYPKSLFPRSYINYPDFELEKTKRRVAERSQAPRPPLLTRLGGGIVTSFRDFCLYTSIHGFNHIAMPRRMLIERLLWLLVVSAAIWGAVDVSLGQWQRYNENPTVVALEKDFRSWKYPLPAVTECLAHKTDKSKVAPAIKKFWNVTPSDEKYSYYEAFVELVADSTLFDLEGFQEYAHDESLNVDMFQLAVDVFPESATRVSWSSPAASKWFPVMTEAGVCHVLNAVAIYDVALVKVSINDTKEYPLTCLYSALSCFLILEVSENTYFRVHSPFDIMDVTSPPTFLYLTMNRKTEVSVVETRTGPGVHDLSVRRRGCLYVDEPQQQGRQMYSANMCRRGCRNKRAIELCGCKPFYNFYEEGTPCTPAGMACLAQFKVNLTSLKCRCMLQCVDAVFKELGYEDQFWSKGPFAARGSIRFTVQAPRTRYTREIVFHFQDLIVSFGGAAGLFLGASFLSFVEIFYFVLERFLTKCCGDTSNTRMVTEVKPSQQAMSHEKQRMRQLSAVLENNQNYNRHRLNMMY